MTDFQALLAMLQRTSTPYDREDDWNMLLVERSDYPGVALKLTVRNTGPHLGRNGHASVWLFDGDGMLLATGAGR